MAHLSDALEILPRPAERRDDNWILTYTGKQFWPTSPRPEDIDIEDIYHALSLTCRFAGHCHEFYSVAQHSVLVAQHVPHDDFMWAMLHDASEAYLADVARPVKKSPEMEGYRLIESRLMRCIAERFDLPWPMPCSVKVADLRALATERRDLMPRSSQKWPCLEGLSPFSERIEPLTPSESRIFFHSHIRDYIA